MELVRRKGTATTISFPMIDATSSASFKSGLSPVDAAYASDDGGQTWSPLAIAATAVEIGSTGMYALRLSAEEMNHDWIVIKFTASGAADQMVLVQTAVATEVHLAKAALVNKKTHTVATGVDKVFDDDGSTTLVTLTPSEADGVITRNAE